MTIFLIKESSEQPPVTGAVPTTYWAGKCWEIDVGSLEQLLQIAKDVGHPLIIMPHYDGIHTRADREWELEIYDSWRE